MIMSDQIKCPVCGKFGIPDYHKENVVCPCCGTDLSIYKLLTDSQTKSTPQNPGLKYWKIATTVLAVVAITTTIFLLISKTDKVVVKDDTLKAEMTILNDSIQKLVSQLESANQELATLKNNSINNYVYIVQKNDSPCKISRKLYGTERRYKEIEAIITKPLQPGDTLYIK